MTTQTSKSGRFDSLLAVLTIAFALIAGLSYWAGYNRGQESMPKYDWDWYRAEAHRVADGVILDVPWVDVKFTEDGPVLGDVHVALTEDTYIKFPGAITMDIQHMKQDPRYFPKNCIIRGEWATCSNIAGHWSGAGTLHFNVGNAVPQSEWPENWHAAP